MRRNSRSNDFRTRVFERQYVPRATDRIDSLLGHRTLNEIQDEAQASRRRQRAEEIAAAELALDQRRQQEARQAPPEQTPPA